MLLSDLDLHGYSGAEWWQCRVEYQQQNERKGGDGHDCDEHHLL